MKTIKLNYKKSTKGTHVYEDSTVDAPVPSLYIKRKALPEDPPKLLTITIDELIDES